MLRKLIQDHQPQYIAASFDLAGPTFRSDMATDYKANRAPMPPDLAEQIPWVHEACEALGVPILTYERFEADDVIGTLATRAAAEGFEVAIVTGDKDFFQLVHDGIRVYNPRDEGTWYDADGREGEVRRRAGAGRRRARADGRLDRQHQGRAGHRREGRARSDRHVRLARRAARARVGGLEQAVPRRAARRTPRTRGRAASWRASGPTCRSSSMPRALRYRGGSRERCFELFTRLGFRTLVMEYAPDAQTIGKDYALVRTLDEVRELARGARRRRALRRARAAGRAVRDAGGNRRPRVLDRPAPCALRAARRSPSSDGDLFGSGPPDDAATAPSAWPTRSRC